MTAQNKIIYWFSEIGKEDIALVGGKGANLGEIYNLGIPVPPGFIISSYAYFYFIKENNLKEKIADILREVDKNRPESFTSVSEKIKKLIVSAPIPEEISREVIKAYFKLGGLLKNPLVAVRSSATAEDLPDASFAGQQRTFLNIAGETNLIEAVRECWASLFEARAIFYRQEKNFDDFKVGLAIPVQKMIQSKASGIVFTCDPVTGEKNKIIVDAVYGLGELIVQGEVIPDHFVVDKENFKIVKKIISDQKIMLIKKNGKTKKYSVPSKWQKKQKISDKEVIKIAKIAEKLHEHYFFPQDCEFAVDNKRRVFFVQTRPVTTLKDFSKDKSTSEEVKEIKKAEDEISDKKIILEGAAASPGIGWGKVVLIKSKKEINKVKQGDVLVTSMTTPDFVPAMKKVSAIVTDKGGLTSHAAIVSRELGVPCVVGTEIATKILKNGAVITVDGGKGKIYLGGLKIKSKIIEPNEISHGVNANLMLNTATKLYVNLADYSIAKDVAKKNIDGIGLLRAEFMMAEIGTHPKKIINDHKKNDFIDKLAEKMAIFCSEFKDRPVVYRATDFKSNEYRSLKGGDLYEPIEANPMLGFRGAYRYIVNEDVFSMELSAIKKVRNKMGFKNLWLMIPFVRTPEELMQVKKIITANGLTRSASFKLWMMAEIPSNVILLEEFLKVGIDGVSIGSNDLTMLIMGTDRDNSEVATIFDERNPAVLWALEKIIKTCHKNNITCSICGQAPSQYPELVEKLVDYGITSISVNPDAIERTREIIYAAEAKLVNKK
ncbi:phosphoenolpyruvate synthase [Candidatus Shapirobacteria bacterium CG10_big_fil_rev_8_21_14_0_10_38_14]|uniref:Phosphoenolpyruvate synthase n=1 Tax=Candidatus Shapirobacteria bacterium CG10_big_fil_rev_8_21_14_0_10_38_14 TaxID=1974483 RepID=A0A2M8L6A7_9BACT|nr:MAG: phosphoenolpyruvate synthase [Candidatus Shapirobacteria bacterium CG10_big_fil_rev_8_21_14_0_10_38_14]